MAFSCIYFSSDAKWLLLLLLLSLWGEIYDGHWFGLALNGSLLLLPASICALLLPINSPNLQ